MLLVVHKMIRVCSVDVGSQSSARGSVPVVVAARVRDVVVGTVVTLSVSRR